MKPSKLKPTPMTLEEAGARQRAWQRAYKRELRAGATKDVAAGVALEEADSVLAALRAGKPEPDFGRARLPAEIRGMHIRADRSLRSYIAVDPKVAEKVERLASQRGLTPSELIAEWLSNAQAKHQ